MIVKNGFRRASFRWPNFTMEREIEGQLRKIHSWDESFEFLVSSDECRWFESSRILSAESIAEHDSCAEQRIRLIDTFFPGFLPGETFRANISNSLSLLFLHLSSRMKIQKMKSEVVIARQKLFWRESVGK